MLKKNTAATLDTGLPGYIIILFNVDYQARHNQDKFFFKMTDRKTYYDT